MGSDTSETLPISASSGKRASFFRRNRRTVALAALAVVVAATTVIVWVSTTSRSSYYYATPPTPAGEHAPAIPGVKIPPRRRSIIVLGDSTTQYGGEAQGWEVMLHGNYVRSLDTFNRGLSGYNTRVFLQYAMPGIVEEVKNYYDPIVIVMWFGVNDATLEIGPNRAQHVPVGEYKANLIEIINQFRSVAPTSSILLLSPAYIDEIQRHRAVGTPLDRSNEETIKYAKACTEIKEQVFKDDDKVGYIDVYGYFVDKYPSDKERAEMLKDGLHFTPRGDRVFYELVKDKIEDMVSSNLLKQPQFPIDTEIIKY